MLQAEYDKQIELGIQHTREVNLRRLMKSNGLGEHFKNRTFDNFRITTSCQRNAFDIATKYCREWGKHEGKGIFITGNVGTGKTHIAAAITLELNQKGVQALFITSIKLLQKIKDTYDGSSDIKTYKNAELLIIDDLGKEQVTEWALVQLFELINDRYEQNLPVVITTNYSDEEIITRYTLKGGDKTTAQAIVSRLREMTWGVLMNGADYREG